LDLKRPRGFSERGPQQGGRKEKGKLRQNARQSCAAQNDGIRLEWGVVHLSHGIDLLGGYWEGGGGTEEGARRQHPLILVAPG